MAAPSLAHWSGAYTTDRAAALAGIPIRTVYHWVETGLVVPSVSRFKVMLWSYADLLVLRLIDWLRSREKPGVEVEIPKTSMQKIRRELALFESLPQDLLAEDLEVYVDHRGRLVFEKGNQPFIRLGAGVDQLLGTKVSLVRWFESSRPGIRAPDLVRPGPTLQIIPGKLSGEPHVEGTRIPTKSLAALGRRGFDIEGIRQLYPSLESQNVQDALDLEVLLARNIGKRAA